MIKVSNLTSNKQQFLEALSCLLDVHKVSYDEIALSTGIGSDILKNTNNGRRFTASTPRLKALKAYLSELESDTVMPGNLQQEFSRLLAENEALRKELRRLDLEYRARFESLESQMLVLKRHLENGKDS